MEEAGKIYRADQAAFRDSLRDVAHRIEGPEAKLIAIISHGYNNYAVTLITMQKTENAVSKSRRLAIQGSMIEIIFNYVLVLVVTGVKFTVELTL